MPDPVAERQRLLDLCMGKFPNSVRETFQIPLMTSILYNVTALIIGRLCRSIIRRQISWHHYLIFFDVIVTFQLLAMLLENIQIRNHYGDYAFMMALFLGTTIHHSTVKGGFANPTAFVLKYFRGEMTLGNAVKRMFFQFIGALCALGYAKLFWSLNLTESHTLRHHATTCVPDLSVAPAKGFLIEFGGTIIDNLMWFNRFTMTHGYYEAVVKTFIISYMTMLAIDLTGFFLNPLNAMNWTFGCHGLSPFEFGVVYVAGPFLGVIIAFKLQRNIVIPYIIRAQMPLGYSTRETSYDENNRINSNNNSYEKLRLSTDGYDWFSKGMEKPSVCTDLFYSGDGRCLSVNRQRSGIVFNRGLSTAPISRPGFQNTVYADSNFGDDDYENEETDEEYDDCETEAQSMANLRQRRYLVA